MDEDDKRVPTAFEQRVYKVRDTLAAARGARHCCTPQTQRRAARSRRPQLSSGKRHSLVALGAWPALNATALTDGVPPPTRPSQLCSAIPKGRVSTYGDLAKALSPPSCARAVGQAMRRNPFAPRVPCHRVIASDLRLGGFSGFWVRRARAHAALAFAARGQPRAPW